MTIWNKIVVLALLLAIIPLAQAQVFERATNLRIVGEESLKSIFEYQDQQIINETILSREGDICYLEKPIHVSPDSKLSLLGEHCKELRLYPDTYIRIAGSADFINIKVTSADRATKKPIIITKENYDSHRPHIFTQIPAKHILIKDSEFSYLGYYEEYLGSSWGLTLRDLAAGRIENSIFHHNYFGLYTFNTENVAIINNEVYDNVEYGLDFHDYSNNFIVANNSVHDNGNHGIIFSKYCFNNKIVGNHVYNHIGQTFVKGQLKDYGIHGIMLHAHSDNSIIEGNILKNNNRAIVLYRSYNNTVVNNIVLDDAGDGVYVDNSSRNFIDNNIILGTRGYGLYSHNSPHNSYGNNYFKKGTYFKVSNSEHSSSLTSLLPYVTADDPLSQRPKSIPLVKAGKTFLELKTYVLLGIIGIIMTGFMVELIYRKVRK